MKRTALLLLPLLLLLAAFWALTSGTETAPQSATTAETKAPDTAVAANANAAEVATAAATATDASARREAAPEAGSAPPIPADAEWLEITVVDRISDQPIAGAEVGWHDNAVYQRQELTDEDRMALWRDPEFAARRFGWRTRSDEHGIARIAVTEAAVITARKGSLYGSVAITRSAPVPPEGHRVSLAADQALLVQVLTADDKPAVGVDVELALHGTDGAFVRQLGWGALARSEAPDGIATITHLQDWRHRDARDRPLATAVTLRARARLPGFTDPGVAFDADAARSEPLVLHLPPCGSAKVRVEQRGQPLPPLASLSLGVYAGTVDKENHERTGWRKPDADGWSRFPWLPVNVRYVATAQLDRGNLKQAFAGPMTPGEEVTVAVPMPDDYILVRCRVVDAERRPIAEQRLTVSFMLAERWGGLSAKTDADGVFVACLGQSRHDNRLDQFRVDLDAQDREPLRGKLPPRTLAVGPQDLGDVTLALLPLVVAGHFLHGDAPFTGAMAFQVEQLQSERDQQGHDNWDTLGDVHEHQDRKTGTFSLRGEVQPGRYRLRFWAYENLPVEPVEFRLGETDLRVQVQPGSGLAASLLLPADCPGGIEAKLTPEAGTNKLTDENYSWRYQTAPQSQDGKRSHLQWQSLPGGSYTLAIRLHDSDEPLLQITGIAVPQPAGGDARLSDIDLRGMLDVLTVVVTDPAGKPVTGNGQLFVLPAPAAGDHAYDFDQGVVRLPVRTGHHDVLVVMGGYRPQELRAAHGRVELRLQPWPVVEILVTSPPLPEGYTLLASLRPRDDEQANWPPSWPRGGNVRQRNFQPRASNIEVNDGRATLQIGDSPSLFSCSIRKGKGGSTRSIAGVTPAVIAGGSTTAMVTVPAEGLQKAIAELDKQDKARRK